MQSIEKISDSVFCLQWKRIFSSISLHLLFFQEADSSFDKCQTRVMWSAADKVEYFWIFLESYIAPLTPYPPHMAPLGSLLLHCYLIYEGAWLLLSPVDLGQFWRHLKPTIWRQPTPSLPLSSPDNLFTDLQLGCQGGGWCHRCLFCNYFL